MFVQSPCCFFVLICSNCAELTSVWSFITENKQVWGQKNQHQLAMSLILSTSADKVSWKKHFDDSLSCFVTVWIEWAYM